MLEFTSQKMKIGPGGQTKAWLRIKAKCHKNLILKVFVVNSNARNFKSLGNSAIDVYLLTHYGRI